MDDANVWFRAIEIIRRHDSDDGPDRAVLLAECGDDPALREALERLLNEHDESTRLSDDVDELLGFENDDGAMPTVEGIDIVERIGRGGSGDVYLGRQREPSRNVAVKVMRRGLVSSKARARFEREALALASISHPNVAVVHAVGRAKLPGGSDAPCIVMEWIEGRALSEDGQKRDARSAARLAAKIARGVHAAHQRGIVHRDVKPANVLLTAQGEPKVVDFGIALLDDPSAIGTLQTVKGELLGTIAYMSPEQLDGHSDAVDVRTDVYALGLVFFELIEGRPAIGQTGTGSIAAIRDVAQGALPSLTGVGKDAATIYRKATSREADRRYESASAFADDLDRFAEGRPISARPPTAGYVLQSYVRRNPVVAGLAALCGLALVGGLAGTSIGLYNANVQRALASKRAAEATAARDEATTRTRELEQVADFQNSMLRSIDATSMGETIRNAIADGLGGEDPATPHAALDGVNFTDVAINALKQNVIGNAIEEIDARFADQPSVRGQLLRSSGRTLTEIGLLDEAEEPLLRAIDVLRETHGEQHRQTLLAQNSLGELRSWQGRHEDAERIFLETLKGCRAVFGQEHATTLRLVNNLGLTYRYLDRMEDAERYLRESLETTERLLGTSHPDTLRAYNNMGFLYQAMGRLEEAEPVYRAALTISRETNGDDHPSTVILINNLAVTLKDLGRIAEAEPFYLEALETTTRVLGERHPQTLIILYGNVGLQSILGNHAKAEEMGLACHAGNLALFGAEHPETRDAVGLMATVYDQWHKADPAAGHDTRADEWRARLPAPGE